LSECRWRKKNTEEVKMCFLDQRNKDSKWNENTENDDQKTKKKPKKQKVYHSPVSKNLFKKQNCNFRSATPTRPNLLDCAISPKFTEKRNKEKNRKVRTNYFARSKAQFGAQK
jgi:hypothetical protein